MKRTLLLSTIAAFIGLTAMPALADDRGAQDQILKGATPDEQEFLQAPHHFNDSATAGRQVAQVPSYQSRIAKGMTNSSGRRDGSGFAVGIAAPSEREIHSRQLANGLSVD